MPGCKDQRFLQSQNIAYPPHITSHFHTRRYVHTYIFVKLVQQCFVGTELGKANVEFHCIFLKSNRRQP